MPRETRAPRGSVFVLDRAEVARVLAAVPVPRRADARANWLMVLAVLPMFMNDRGEIRAGHVAIAMRAGRRAGRPISASTAGRIVRALEAAGVLFVAQRGYSAVISGRNHNVVTIYLVLAPEPVELSEVERRQLEALASRLEKPQVTVQSDDPEVLLGVDLTEVDMGRSVGGRFPSTPQRKIHPERFTPRSRAEKVASAHYLAQMLRWYPSRHLLDEIYRSTAPFWTAGWTAAAVHTALEHPPEGGRHFSQIDEGARRPMAVFNARLNLWRTGPGRTPMAPPHLAETPQRGRPAGSRRENASGALPVQRGPAVTVAVQRSSDPVERHPQVAATMAVIRQRRAGRRIESTRPLRDLLAL